MPHTLTTKAPEEGFFPINFTFRDHTGQPVTPTAATWTLTTAAGVVVNGKADVAITPLAQTVTVVLIGEDLIHPIGADTGTQRVLTVQATYTSASYPDILAIPLNDEIKFDIDPFIRITP